MFTATKSEKISIIGSKANVILKTLLNLKGKDVEHTILYKWGKRILFLRKMKSSNIMFYVSV